MPPPQTALLRRLERRGVAKATLHKPFEELLVTDIPELDVVAKGKTPPPAK